MKKEESLKEFFKRMDKLEETTINDIVNGKESKKSSNYVDIVVCVITALPVMIWLALVLTSCFK